MAHSASELQTWLARRLKRVRVPDYLWASLTSSGATDRAMEVGPTDELVNAARRIMRSIRPSKPRKTGPGRRARPKDEPLVNSYEESRARAFSNCIAGQAATWPDVRRFRQELFAGQVLTRDQARSLLSSAAARYLGPQRFEAEGIPLLEHRGMEVGRPEFSPSERFGRRAVHEKRMLRIEWGQDQQREVPAEREYSWPQPADFRKEMLVLEADTWVARSVWMGSALWKLRELALELTRSFPWQEEQATWFVLTGEPPLVLPLGLPSFESKVGTYRYMRYTISIEPWVSARSLLKVYRHIQRAALGPRIRPLSKRSIELFEFVTARMDPEGQIPSWRALMEEWNRTHRRNQYKSAWKLSRDYRRAGGIIVFPRYEVVFGPRRSGKNSSSEGGDRENG